MKKLDLLVFDVKGKFAHFRKFYTNSSSLSYSVPPRTTVAGMIAAILGLERDSYYTDFSKENVKIAVRKMSVNRKLMVTMNYIKATNINEVIKAKEHTQIPLELLTSEENVCYRIYVNIKDAKLMKELEKRLEEKKYFYAPYLGAAPFNCKFDFIGKINGVIHKDMKKEIEVSSVINSDYIVDESIDVLSPNLCLIKEKMPCDFLEGRVIKKADSYILNENCESIKLKVKEEYVNLEYQGITENIVFM
jgi:CRISPR-associated protein Cas5h